MISFNADLLSTKKLHSRYCNDIEHQHQTGEQKWISHSAEEKSIVNTCIGYWHNRRREKNQCLLLNNKCPCYWHTQIPLFVDLRAQILSLMWYHKPYRVWCLWLKKKDEIGKKLSTTTKTMMLMMMLTMMEERKMSHEIRHTHTHTQSIQKEMESINNQRTVRIFDRYFVHTLS